MIIYMIALFEFYKTKTFIFAKYTPPKPPPDQNAFYPLGKITPLTPEEIETRNEIIKQSIS
jgi:hypothetical protein